MGPLRSHVSGRNVKGSFALARIRRGIGRNCSAAAARPIENAPAKEVIARYDTKETLFYVDPPYEHDARGDASAYGFEMSNEDHEELAEVLNGIRGRAVLSGYRTDLYDRLFADWTRIDAAKRTCHSVRKPRQESVWLNF